LAFCLGKRLAQSLIVIAQLRDNRDSTGRIASVEMLTKPDAVFKVSKILEHESNRWRASDIYLDQYSGKV
jgi:hypothetical protein